jgi:hypothetical protein
LICREVGCGSLVVDCGHLQPGDRGYISLEERELAIQLENEAKKKLQIEMKELDILNRQKIMEDIEKNNILRRKEARKSAVREKNRPLKEADTRPLTSDHDNVCSKTSQVKDQHKKKLKNRKDKKSSFDGSKQSRKENLSIKRLEEEYR